jgi:recombination protein RecT
MTEIKRPQYEMILYDKKIKDRFLEIVDEKTYNKEIIFAKQIFDGNDKLQTCPAESIRNAIVNIALTGATLNPALQQAYLIPRKGKCCLDFSYRGLCKIAVDSTSVYDIDASAVYEGDDFYYEMGLNPILRHVPKMGDTDKEKGKVIAAYAVATLHHGIKKFVVLDKEKIERARQSSQYAVVWTAHYDEMAKKTAVKLLYKLLPQSERMSVAVAAINEHEGIAKGPTTSDELQKRFGIKKDDPDIIEGEEIITCPIDDTIPVEKTCSACEQKEGCRVMQQLKAA